MLTSLFTALVLLGLPATDGANASGKPGDGVGRLPSKAPAAVGMSATRLQKIDRVMARAIKAGGFPGGVVYIGRRGASVLEKGFGNLSWSGKSPADPQETIYDLASLTKSSRRQQRS